MNEESAETNERLNIIVLSIDGLGARFLGPYGNTWIDTPAINRLAASGVLFENACAVNVSGKNVEAFGRLGLQSHFGELEDKHTFLVHDEHEHGLSGDFESVVHVELRQAKERAKDWSSTHLARMFATMFSQLEDHAASFNSGSNPFLGWCHSTFLTKYWDAPAEFSQQYASEEDPEPYAQTRPPSGEFALLETDPDTLLSFSHAYAAQIVVLDHCIDALVSCLEELKIADSTAIVLTSSFGYPLGEHGFVGPDERCLNGEATHIPLLIGLPLHRSYSRRFQAPFHFHHLERYLKATTGHERLLTSIVEQRQAFPFVCCANDIGQVISSPAWMMRQSAEQRLLFAKPDDKWEVNDVASLCAEIVDSLSEVLSKMTDDVERDPETLDFGRELIFRSD